MPFCAECGAEHQGARFCANCGSPLTAQDAAAVPATPVPQAEVDDEDEQEIWRGAPDPVLAPVAARTTTYIVTSERIKLDRGKLRKRIESIELYRVKDIQVHRTLTQRTRRRGDLIITSTDASTPDFYFESIEAPEELAETIRGLVKAAKRRVGVAARESV